VHLTTAKLYRIKEGYRTAKKTGIVITTDDDCKQQIPTVVVCLQHRWQHLCYDDVRARL